MAEVPDTAAAEAKEPSSSKAAEPAVDRTASAGADAEDRSLEVESALGQRRLVVASSS